MAKGNIDEYLKKAELIKLRAEIAKVREETYKLKYSEKTWEGKITRFSPILVPLITAVISVSSFLLGGIIQQGVELKKVAQQNYAELKKVEEQSKVELEKIRLQSQMVEKQQRMKIYENQIQIYFDMSNTAAQISVGGRETDKLRQHFQELYYGNLNLIETDEEVSRTAKRFMDCFSNKSDQTEQCNLQKSAI